MAVKYTEEQLNNVDKSFLVSMVLSMQETAERNAQELHEQSKMIKELTDKVNQLTEQLILSNHNRFGRSSEKMVDHDQICFKEVDGEIVFFNEAEAVSTLDENENDILRDGKMLYISNLVRRLERLREDTDSLKNTVEHLQDAYYSYLDTQMNKTMKILTVLTTLFFPLTIIVGWYGMNFAAMPELTWKYGYIYVILLSVVVVLLLWKIGKKKNWFR